MQHPVARILREHGEGVLAAGESVRRCLFVLHGGALVLPVPAGTLREESWTLVVPEETDDAMQLLLTPMLIDATHPGIDRWSAYHGRSGDNTWVTARIESAKLGADVIDGSEIDLNNPIAGDERSLCALVNRNHEGLVRACQRRAGVEPQEPRVVGIDAWGLDVRARFGMLRLEFEREATTRELAESAISDLVGME